MAAYRKNNANDRDALFGGASAGGGGSGKSKKPSGGGRDELFGNASGGGGGKPAPRAAAPPPAGQDPMARLREMKKNQNKRPAMADGEQRETKLKEAMDYRDKANKCMAKSFFGPKPDPVAASTFFKRAADAYQQLGDMGREERLYRIQSAQCNQIIGAWASVAHDYTRAAVLLQQEMDNGVKDETIADPAVELSSYYNFAAEAWTQLNEKSKAAGAQIKAACALNTGSSAKNLSKPALAAMEVAVEAHVPDVLNPFARYRQTGRSAFLGDDPEETVAKPRPETLELARQHVVTAAYAHEPLQELVTLLVSHYREYPTALYACGAASYLLQVDGNSTLSCSRSYATETILLLAMGDAVAAQEQFLNRHVQKDFYLNSRECKLSEELFRAILNRDPDALEEARSPSGENSAALANLHSTLRQLVTELRIQGVAKPAGHEKPRKPKAVAPAGAGAGPPARKGPPPPGGAPRTQSSGGSAGSGPPRQQGPPGGAPGGPPQRQPSGNGGPPQRQSVPPGGPQRQPSGGPPGGPQRQPSGGPPGGPPQRPPGNGGPPQQQRQPSGGPSQRPAGGGGAPPPGAPQRGPPPPQQQQRGPPSQQQQQRGPPPPPQQQRGPPPASAEDASFAALMNMKTGYEKEVQAGAKLDGNALAAELDDLDFGGLGDSDDDGGGADDDDDDLDLR